MKPNDFVIATRPINGIKINSVGIVNSTTVQYALVCFIGKNGNDQSILYFSSYYKC